MKTVIFAKDVNLSKLVEMLKICPCCKYVSNLYQTITFTWLLRINTYLANICICPHFSRQRKCNANLELQIYHTFAPFANISKSVFSSSERDWCLSSLLYFTAPPRNGKLMASTFTRFSIWVFVQVMVASLLVGKNGVSYFKQHNTSRFCTLQIDTPFLKNSKSMFRTRQLCKMF